MKRRHWLRAAGMLGLAPALAGTAGATDLDLSTPPPAGPPVALRLPRFESFKLANGLQVIVAPRARVPLVSASVLLRAGRETDPEGRAGLASSTVDLLSKGARRGGREVGATALARQAEALGGALETGLGWRSASLGMAVTTPRIAPALALMADVVRRPLLATDEFERARAQSLDGLRLAMASPGAVAGMAARRVFWGRGPWAASTTPASLQRLDVTALRALHRRRYQPSRALLVLAGDIDADAARRLAQPLFGDWADGDGDRGRDLDRGGNGAVAPLEALSLASAPASAAPALVLVDMPGSGQSGVVLAAPFAQVDDADRRIGELASAVLGGGYSARLNQEVRIRRGLSYGVFASAEPQPGGGMWTAQAQTQHATAAEVVQLLRRLTLQLGQEAPTASELAARQATLVGSFARRLETAGGLAAMLGAQWAQGRAIDELARYTDEVMAVTPAQVQDFAARHWHAETLRVVVAGDLSAGGAALRALDADALVRPLGRLDLEDPLLGRG